MPKRAIVPALLLVAAFLLPKGVRIAKEAGAQGRPKGASSVSSLGNPYLEVPAAIRNMYHPQRFPDLYLLTRPNCLFTGRAEFHRISKGRKPETIAGHGSPWNYDSDVPIIFYGKGIKKGFLGAEAQLTDIAPTLAFLAGVQRPSAATGRVLHEILDPAAAAWGAAQRPRVLVLFSLDQCRSDYIHLYDDAFAFIKKHAIADGSTFAQGRVPNAKTETAVSHASVGTGTIAGIHGITGNNIIQPDGSYPLAIDDGNAGLRYGYGDLKPATGARP